MNALAQVGVAADLLKMGVPEAAGGIRTATGDLLTAPMSVQTFAQRFGMPSLIVHRADLQDLLLQQVGDGVHLNAHCVGYTQDAQGVTARFADGREARGDCLIGADGLASVIRAQLHGPTPPTYAGYTAWRAVVPFDHQRLLVGESWGRGTRFGLFPLPGGRAYWFATQNVPPGQDVPVRQRKQTLLRLFRGWHAPIEALIEATDEQAILRHDVYDRDPLPRWSEGRVTLLGDAAHPMTPNLGQGACQAIEDAVALAHILRTDHNIATALRTYEAQRIPRTSEIVRLARRLGQVGQWENPLACRLRDTLLKLTPARLQNRQFDQLLGYTVR